MKLPTAADIVLLGLASHKLSRLVARERVTTPLRAPFVEGEQEEPAGKGLQRALGELLTCPYCVSPWITLGLGAGLVYRPVATRFVSSLFASLVVSDVLHHGYSILRATQKRTQRRAELLRREVERGAAEPALER
jgi:hypothetical protein